VDGKGRSRATVFSWGRRVVIQKLCHVSVCKVLTRGIILEYSTRTRNAVMFVKRTGIPYLVIMAAARN